ncbi:hypothetical protein AMATHDRAFT_134798 [Amanita thiersii Skay4041]|uniref:AMP-dependent synthetase/ligase domain-containing protein n=1 Tax=Amanita thiersii Skay4041 TaxID=703135 RepID=A0A2A9P1Y9_9AGAR|nr:hypothetical protein AMATHDRAFT_134798 [Amanita thiersii Skay4041]
MSLFHAPSSLLPPIPDNLTIPQFILDTNLPYRPLRPSNVPWFIEDQSGRKIFYPEVRERTYNLASALCTQFQLICLFSPNHTDYATVIWAVQSFGGVITPSNPTYTVDELVHQLKITEASLIVVHPMFFTTALGAAKVVGLPKERIVLLEKGPGAGNFAISDLLQLASSQQSHYVPKRLKSGEARTKIAFLSFSSGTTGKPKAVAIPHFSVIANVIQMATHYRITDPTQKDQRLIPGDIAMAVLPFFHIYGLVVTMHFSLFCGMSLVVVPKFSFTEFLKSIVRYRATHLYLVPPQIVLLCKASLQHYDFSHVKYCMSGAAPLSGELMQKITKLLPNAAIGQGYGLTETCTTISMLPSEQRVGTIGSAGQLIPGIAARVVKPDGSLAGEGEQGELVVKGPSMSLGYYKNPEATKETFVDGWVRTGDEVIIKNAEIFVVDRLKEIIKVRGFQVAPAELEGHLLLHPDVADACIVGIPDDYSGEIPLAYVVPTEAASARIAANPEEAQNLTDALKKHVSDAKVQYKWLAGGIEFIDVIPKNPSGKILRRVLRDKARAARTIVKAKL